MLSSNLQKFNGKELQTVGSSSLRFLDYGARMYDPTTVRWLTQDPMAEKYYGYSPYNYCVGNPVLYVDEEGNGPVLGAILGGVSSYVAQVSANVIKNGLSLNAFGKDIEWLEFAKDVAVGGLTSGASVIKKLVFSIAGTTIKEVADIIWNENSVEMAGHNILMSILCESAGSGINIKGSINLISNKKLMNLIRENFGPLSKESAKHLQQAIKKAKQHIQDDVVQLVNSPVDLGVATVNNVVSIDNKKEKSNEEKAKEESQD